MWLEVLAAALVGAALVWLVFEPLFAPARPRAPDAMALEDLEEAELTRSGAALTALKEIEFDRETGKLGDEDYAFLKQKYTAEELLALRAESAEAPVDVEAAVAARVAQIRAARFCGNCGSPLEAGSRFCAACGGRVAA